MRALPSFDAKAPADDLASVVLANPNPLELLESWLCDAEPRALAAVLRVVYRKLQTGEVEHGMLSTTELNVTLGEKPVRLDIFLLPSIFAPEEWSITFLEGLLRKPMREYADRVVVELGTGSGWVSLALLELTPIKSMLGVDLNPQAVLVARLNGVLNGFSADGAPRPSRLHERFHAVASDLLAAPVAQGVQADLVVGCIPQVIAPTLDINMQSTEGLYDLSNYFVAQGMVEDQFGLGLNARALQEALHVLRPEGRVVLNLAGRPGNAVVDRMWRRRGYVPETLWRARVRQAGDTDIRPLVDLEARTGEPFAFFAHRRSSTSITARIAQSLLEARRPIYHELQVVEGRLQSETLLDLARDVRALGMDGIWNRVDLSDATDEQLRFVSRLALLMKKSPRAPYTHEAGDVDFRRRLVGFLGKFQGVELSPQEAFVAPSREELLYAALHCVLERGRPAGVVAANELRGVYKSALAKYGVDPVWVDDSDLAELAELLPLLHPKVVIIRSSARWRDLEAVLAACGALGALLILDDSDAFSITSRAADCPGLQFLQAHQSDGHLAVAVGLVHSAPFPDVHLGLLFSRNPGLMQAMCAAAEVTYSRISYFHQAYYDSLFDELLTFGVRQSFGPGASPPTPVGGVDSNMSPVGSPTPVAPAGALAAPHPPGALAAGASMGAGGLVGEGMQGVLRLDAFTRPGPQGDDIIRLDYGENELPMPRQLQMGILRGFLDPPGACHGTGGGGGAAGDRPTALAAAAGYLRATRLPSVTPEQVMLGAGAIPLLHDGLLAAARGLPTGREGTPLRVLLPAGAYGVFPALVRAVGGEVVWLETPPPQFLAGPVDLAAAPDFDVLLLTSPGNPTAAAYDPPALAELVQAAAARGARVVLDEAYGMLADLGGDVPAAVDRWEGLSDEACNGLLVVCTLSKEFAGGGVRLGVAATASREWLWAMRSLRLAPIPNNAQVLTETLFEDMSVGGQWAGGLLEDLRDMRATLRGNRAVLASAFRDAGLAVEEGEGGALFFCADTAGRAGGDPGGWVARLEAEGRVRINTPGWSRTGTLARACYSLDRARVEEAAGRIRAFGRA